MKLSTKVIRIVFLISLVLTTLEASGFFRTIDEIIKDNIRDFKRGHIFICALTISSSSNAMLVDKDNGWSIYNNKYFRKKEFLIHIFNCKKAPNIKKEKLPWRIF